MANYINLVFRLREDTAALQRFSIFQLRYIGCNIESYQKRSALGDASHNKPDRKSLSVLLLRLPQ